MHYSASFNVYNTIYVGDGKLAYLKVDIGKIPGKFPWMSKLPLQGNGMAANPKPPEKAFTGIQSHSIEKQ